MRWLLLPMKMVAKQSHYTTMGLRGPTTPALGEKMAKFIECGIYTDGGCRGNPGPGGWAFLLMMGSETIERSGAQAATTNNRMELTAVIEALGMLETVAGDCSGVQVYTDSRYVKDGIGDWIARWQANGWRTAAKQPVKNRELWQRLLVLERRHRIVWNWLKAHAGHPHNERCDLLVQQAIDAFLAQASQ